MASFEKRDVFAVDQEVCQLHGAPGVAPGGGVRGAEGLPQTGPVGEREALAVHRECAGVQAQVPLLPHRDRRAHSHHQSGGHVRVPTPQRLLRENRIQVCRREQEVMIVGTLVQVA